MCHFQAFWVGLNPTRSNFFEIFEAKEQKEKTVKNRKYQKKSANFGEISEKVGNYREKSEIIRKNREKSNKGNFGGDILSISTDFRYFADISAEISKILFPA